MIPFAKRLSALQSALKTHGLDGWVIPVADRFLGEYIQDADQRLAWLCGFTGSAGMAVVLHDRAAIFVDGRYTTQAKLQLEGQAFEIHNSADLSARAWAAKQLQPGQVIGADGALHSAQEISQWEHALQPCGASIRLLSYNLVDEMWEDRPAASGAPVMLHPLKFAGWSVAEKCARVAQELKKHQAAACVLVASDSVNWLCNIRGRDLEYSCVALAYAIAEADGMLTLFMDASRLPDGFAEHTDHCVTVVKPEGFSVHLARYAKQKVMIDRATTPYAIVQQLEQAGAELVAAADPCQAIKALKHPAELQGMRAAHIRDGIALARFFAWLEEAMARGTVTELDIDAKLLEFRGLAPEFICPSFPTIAGSGAHGAIVHYRANAQTSVALERNTLLLIDSGGQYVDGTTDVTRTLAVGTPTPEQREMFTRVLQGHIALAQAVFPKGTRGSQLDVLARQFVWQARKDYDHGTGHGVGAFLHVHEGPARISKRGNDPALEVGMVLSNEPGYYHTNARSIETQSIGNTQPTARKTAALGGDFDADSKMNRHQEGEYGIRIENVVAVVGQGEGWMALETLTHAPIDQRLIDPTLLTPAQVRWINAYHAKVESALAPHLGGHTDRHTRQFLARACQPIV